ncbi:non-ribosomal peptide synthetase [Fusarium fujikuroi]|uniref:Carrier domain-containing protein n=1 Tax=Fusarium fujikuroi TaxID=5127 RepID=A0A9Q9UGN8_FUSFU|nr:non-ribosomal peptide synthetase [Fusarium fujikuroi]VTT58081.1 unnamed protein product [Fusarium fujikuroi]VTT83906.1 unnamed protein product [Fusarium fujikuroi]
MAIKMIDKQVLACNLDAFAGRDTNSTDINEQAIEWLSPTPSAVTLEAAWCVTLRLYTGLDHLSFGSLTQDGIVATKLCNLGPHDTLEDVCSHVQLYDYSDDIVCHYNTAVIFKLDENEGKKLSELIPRGIDVALMVTGSNLGVLARASFMDADEARNLCQNFRHVLNCFQEPNQAVRGITLSDNDVNQILSWNKSQLTRTESLIHDQFARILQRQPDKSAIESWDGNMTYRELDAASSSLAESLSRANIGPGSWVLFCFNKSRWAIVSMLAILKAGGACVPLDPRHPKSRVVQILQATGAQHILVGDADNDIKNRLCNEFPSVKVIGVPHHEVCESQDIDTISLSFDSPAIGLFTSGSTGTPKGIVATHATICTGASSYAHHIGADDKTRVLQFASYTFDVCMVDVFTALLHGGTLCIPSEEERMTGLQEYISRTQPNWAALTPTVARVLDPALSSKSIRKILLVGEMVRESDIAEWLDSGVQVYNVYGPAENNLITTAAKAIRGRASNVGTGINTHTWVADVENERLVPIGAVGELICSGPHLTPGYLNDPERTASSFFEDLSWIPNMMDNKPFSRRFYRSGDLVRYCADGSLQCVGRLDSQVKLGGQRVELSEIESYIKSHNAAVLVPKAGSMKNKLIAVLEGAGSSGQSLGISSCDPGVAQQVEQVLRKNLPSYMCPSIWISVPHLPLSSSGKLDRKVLMNKLETLSHEEYLGLILDHAQDEDDQDGHETDNCQRLLREACSQVLNIPVERIAMSRAFAGHGGDSITAMQVSSLIKRTQTLVVTVKDLLTCHSLAEAASSMREVVTSIQVPTAHPGKLYPLSPIQRLFMATAPTSVTWNHYNQSVLLRIRERRSSDHVKESLGGVVRRHAMLRGRFQRVSSSEWMQRILPDDQGNLFFEYFPDASDYKQREALMLKARESLDIESGPLLRAQLFDGQVEQGMLLFIVSHHLVVDLVSWRVILEELEVSLAQPYGNTTDANDISALLLPQESVPFPVWSELQHEAAKNMDPDRVIPQQYAVPAPDFSYWGISSARNVYRDVIEKSISLGDMTTKNVLYECHEALQTEPVDIFLSAILLSFKRAFPERPIPPIFNEGHGREPWTSDLDISRTVGWFTTMFPIYVPNISAGDVVDTVRRVKDFRKGCAENGFQYFSTKYLHEQGRKTFKDHIPAEIMFNYEGRYQSLEKEKSLLMAEAWEAGEALSDSAPELQRFCLFELSAAVLTDGEIHFTMAWNSRARYQERISLWLTRLLPAVIDEIVTYLMMEKRQYTLSDLSQARLSDYSDLETLMASVSTIPGIDSIEGVEEIYCGSPMQDSLALSQSRISGGVYEIDLTWEVTDGRQGNYQVDVNRLVLAWNDVVARHAALRTVFLEAASSSNDVMLHQVVLRKYRPSTILMHTRDSSQALKQLSSCASYKKRGILIDKRPPHALAICSTDEGRTFVRFQVNHILFDGTSIAPLLRDLSRAYRNSHEVRREWTWNPFANFIRYIRDEKRRSDDLAYWKSYLATARPCQFPTLKDEESIEAPGTEQQRGAVQVCMSDKPSSLRNFLADMGATVPTLVQLVWALVLRMYTSDSQVAFGYLASGRDAPVVDIEQAVGPFISILVHFLDFDNEGQLPIADMLQRIQDRSARSISHQSRSLAEIQDAIGLTGSSLLFNTGISFMPKWTKDMQLRNGSGLIFDQIAANDPTEFDISLIVETGDDGVDGMCIYVDYRTSTVGRMHAVNIAASFDHILSQIIQDPSVPLNDVSGISTRDFDQISNWNRLLSPPKDKCLHDLFIEKVIEDPTREAVFSWDGSMSYGELHDLSARLANYLVHLGVGPEQMIPICFEKSVWTVVTILAVLKAGGCFVLLDPTHPASRLWNIVGEIEASILLCSPLTNRSKKLDASPDMNARKAAIIEIHPSFVNNLKSVSRESQHTPLCPSLSPDNAAYVVFTSGSTGIPKGVVVTHRAVVTGLDELGRAAGMTAMGSGTRTLQFASYSFDASIADIFCALQLGGCVCVMSDEGRSPADITDFIQRSRATYAGITPSFASLLDPRLVPSLRVLCFSGEALPASQIEAWSGYVKMVNMYGPTEASIACIANSEVTRTTDASNIGRAFRGSTWIVDENDHNQLRAIGSSGELLIEGPILAREYLKRPEQTAQAFISNPPWLQNIRPNSRLYKTGDMVRYNTNGTISYIGRKDNQIKINGQRVEVSEIEETLRASIEPEAGLITVELLDRKALGEADVLTAFVYIAGHDPSSTRDDKADNKKPFTIPDNPLLLEYFRSMLPRLESSSSKMPRYMVPQAYIPIDSLPLTTSGKVDRRALRHAAAQLNRNQLFSFASSLDMVHEPSVDVVKDDPVSELAHLWESVLNVRVSGTQSNFFRLGGNSMAAMNLRSQARKAGFQLSVADILANPTLSDMAKGMAPLSLTAPESTSSSSPQSFSTSTSTTIIENDPDTSPFSLLRTRGIALNEGLWQQMFDNADILWSEVEDIFPCTPMQEGLMVLSAHREGHGAYALHAPYKLPSDLDLAKLQFAWEQTTMVHAILRSRIVTHSQGALIVLQKSPVVVQQSTCSTLDDHLEEQRRLIFGYGVPLFRMTMVFDQIAQCHYFVMSIHHALFDGWSFSRMWDTALAIYQGRQLSRDIPSFQSFVQHLGAAPLSASKEYWKSHLVEQDRDGFQFPAVPSTHKPIATASASFEFAFQSTIAMSAGVTPSTMVHAAWAILLSQYTASSTVNFGVTLSGRDFPMPGLDQVVGATIVTLPRQLNINLNQNVIEFLEYVQQEAANVIPHQYLGIHEIRALGLEAQQACNFSTLILVNHNTVDLDSPLSVFGITQVPVDSVDFHPYPLAVEFTVQPESLVVNVCYDPVCIGGSMVESVMQQYDHVLQSLSEGLMCSSGLSGTNLASIMTGIAPAHLQKMLDWNKDGHRYGASRQTHLVLDHIGLNTRNNPRARAVVADDSTLSYAELNRLARVVSHRITQLDISGEFIAVCFDKSAAAIVSMLAVLQTGFAFMPISASQPPARLENLLTAANVQVVLTSPAHTDLLSGLSSHRRIVPVDLKDIDQHEQMQLNRSGSAVDKSRAAYLLYTSGTTGQPKGVVVQHGAWSKAIASQIDFFGFTRDTKMLQFSNYTFDASIFEIFITLCSGGCLFVPSEHSRVNDLEGFIRTNELNTITLTPTVARVIRPGQLPCVRQCLFGGESLTQSDIFAWAQQGRRVTNCYGPTEACVFSCGRDIRLDATDTKVTNIGRPVGINAWIISSMSGSISPIGAPGELCLEGQMLARGYLNDPERTQLSFSNHLPNNIPGKKNSRTYRTGDMVCHEADGTLNFLGRRDGQIKLRGHRIDVGEIEHHIQHAMADDSTYHSSTVQVYWKDTRNKSDAELAALLRMDIQHKECVMGVPCSLLSMPGRADESPTASQLKFKLRRILPEHMTPNTFIAVQHFPTTASGKLDRSFAQRCVEYFVPYTQKEVNKNETWSSSEAIVREWWCSILGVNTDLICRHDNFFGLGGNSIYAIRLVGLARSNGHHLQYEDVFSSPVLADMASRLSRPEDSHVQSETRQPPEPFQLISESDLKSVMDDILPLYNINKDEVEDIYPCTPLQATLMAETARHRGVYILAESIQVPSSQMTLFQDAWLLMFKSYEILRTRIVLSHDQSHGEWQVVMKYQPLTWTEFPDAKSFIEFVYNTHDYGKPLVHLAILGGNGGRIKDTDHSVKVGLCVHHAAYDGWSLSNIWRTITKKLTSSSSYSVGPYTPFNTYIRHLTEQDPEKAKSYWKERFSGLSSASLIPRPQDPGHQSSATDTIQRNLDLPTLSDHLLGKTAIVAQAAWAITISHYTANSDTLCGTILSGREYAAASVPGVETIVGPTIATVPSRTTINYDSCVLDLITAVQKDNLNAVRFSHMGLEQISRLNLDCRQACKFDNLFWVQPDLDETPANSIIRDIINVRGFSSSPMVLEIQLPAEGQKVVVNMSFDRVAVSNQQAELIVDTYITIMDNLLHAPLDTRLRSIAALSPAHISQISRVSSSPVEAVQACVHDLVRKQVELSPSHTAIDAWDGSMAYAALDALSTSLAEKLSGLGIGPESPVCILFEKSKWAIVAMLGVVKTGGCFVPLNPQSPIKRLQHLVESVDASIILVSPQYEELSISLSLHHVKILVISQDTIPSPISALKPSRAFPSSVGPQNAAYILFTSGSTGLPKGVVIEHQALCSSLTVLSSRVGLNSNSRVFQFNAYWFDVMLLDVFGTLISGGTICAPSESDCMDDLAGSINKFNANTIAALSTSVSRLIEPSSIPCLNTLGLGGEPVLSSDRDRWAPHVRLFSMYGPTETCIVSLMTDMTSTTPASLLGHPVGCRVWIVNPLKNDELAPLGGIGELFIEGPGLARYYLVDEDKTAAAFLSNQSWTIQDPSFQGSRRFYKTGDLVRINTDGTVSWIGRKDHSQVKIRGQRVELAEIEETIRQHIPSALTVAVDILIDGERRILAAVFGTNLMLPGLSDTEVEVYMEKLIKGLLPKLNGSLPKHMVPTAFIPLPFLPFLSTGKLDRKALHRLALPLAVELTKRTSTNRQALKTPKERLLSALWSEVLSTSKGEPAGPADNFFNAGGDSMMAMKLVAMARHRGLTLSVVDIFKNPILSDMADLLGPLRHEEEPSKEDSTHMLPIDTSSKLKDSLYEVLTVPPDRIEQIYPCTAYQEMFLSGTEVWPGAHVTQFIFSIDKGTDMHRLEKAMGRCTAEFPTLRTRIVRHGESGQLLQVVLHKGHEAPWSIHLTDDLDSALDQEKKDHWMHSGLSEPLHRLSLVMNNSGCTHLIWSLNHAAYDAWSFGMMLRSLGQDRANSTRHSRTCLPFNGLIRHISKLRDASSESRRFWRSYIADIGSQVLLFRYPSIADPRQDRLAVHQVSFPKHGGRSSTSLITAAWIMLLARLSHRKDITIAYLVTGRTLPLGGIDTCPGPLISKLPLRIQLLDEPRGLVDVADLVRIETVRVMPHEHTGLDAIKDLASQDDDDIHPHAASLLGRFPLDLAIHPAGHTDVDAARSIGITHIGQKVVVPPPGTFSAECSIISEDNYIAVSLAVIWDNRAMDEDDVNRVVEIWKDIIVRG